MFTTAHLDDLDNAPSGLTRDEKMRAITAKTAVHEIGHILDLGEVDDQDGDEVYSGDTDDLTKEFVFSKVKDNSVSLWSVMSTGIPGDSFIPPTGTTYTAFSIEEWLPITKSRANP